MYILILLIPLLGFILSGAFGKYFGREGSAFLSSFGLFITLILAIFFFYEIALCNNVVSIKLYTWFLLDIYSIEIGLLFDTISTTMILVISLISFFVHIYSTQYMSHDPHLSRFMCYLSLFTFFMLILVTADNFLQLFLGWEGVGLCSYLLINFWFTRILANKAALKAMIINRIADVFFIIGIIIIFITFKTTDYIIVFNLLPFVMHDYIIFFNFFFNKINLITFFLFLGAIGKSAQIGLHTWLPDAMEGPTPVSALLHAATMVTAGVFLVIRSSLFFEYSNNILILLCIFGCITALFSGMVAIFQYDIKKIIAYSTCSQLGYMFFSCGLSNYHVAFFHLFNHAFFKALLFLSAGALIHALFDEQDIRKMGNLLICFPFIYIAFFIGSLAILGFPFLSGFYSKDLILELVFSRFIIDSFFIYILSIIGAICTSIYSFKIIFYVFLSNINLNKNIYSYLLHKDENFDIMSISIFFLIFLSIFSGLLFSDMFIGYGSSFWNNSIFIFIDHFFLLDVEYIHPLIKNLPILLSLFVMFLFLFLWNDFFYFFINYDKSFLLNYKIIAPFFYYAFFFNKIYNKFYSIIFYFSYLIFNKYIDKGFLELLGPFGLYKLFRFSFSYISKILTSFIFFYIYIFFYSLCLLILLFIVVNFWNLSFILNNFFLFFFFFIIYFYLF